MLFNDTILQHEFLACDQKAIKSIDLSNKKNDLRNIPRKRAKPNYGWELEISTSLNNQEETEKWECVEMVVYQKLYKDK